MFSELRHLTEIAERLEAIVNNYEYGDDELKSQYWSDYEISKTGFQLLAVTHGYTWLHIKKIICNRYQTNNIKASWLAVTLTTHDFNFFRNIVNLYNIKNYI